MKPLRVIELWGGPGAGKSTTRAALFARLKLMAAAQGPRGATCAEETHEIAKEVTWELGYLYPHGTPPPEAKARALGQRQAELFGGQYRRVIRLRGQVDVVVSDSPLGLSAVYADPVLYPPEHWWPIIAAHYAQIEPLHVWIRRVKPYDTRGRNETEEQARAKDALLRPVWARSPGQHFECDGDEDAPAAIIAQMRSLGWLA